MNLTNLTTPRTRKTPRGHRTASGLASLLVCGALAVLILGAGACATSQPAGQQVDDAAVTAKVKTKIASDPELNPFDIDVDTLDGVVTLRGRVSSREKAQEAEKLARHTEGVSRVENRLEIGASQTVGERVDDAAIASKVDAKLVAATDIAANNIDVDVQDGVVTLSGVVKSAAAKHRAEEVAETVEGVRRVVNELEVG